MKVTFEKIMRHDLFKLIESAFFNNAVKLISNRKYHESIPDIQRQDADMRESIKSSLKSASAIIKGLIEHNFNSIDIDTNQKNKYYRYIESTHKRHMPDNDLRDFYIHRKFANSSLNTRLNYLQGFGKIFTPFDEAGQILFISFFEIYVEEYNLLGLYLETYRSKYFVIRLWNSNDIKTIRVFYNSLLDNDYIDKVDEEIFIDHFIGNSFTRKINWISSKTALVRLFDAITRAINPSYLQNKNNTVSAKELAKHFNHKGSEIEPKTLIKIRNASKDVKIKEELQINTIASSLRKYFPDV